MQSLAFICQKCGDSRLITYKELLNEGCLPLCKKCDLIMIFTDTQIMSNFDLLFYDNYFLGANVELQSDYFKYLYKYVEVYQKIVKLVYHMDIFGLHDYLSIESVYASPIFRCLTGINIMPPFDDRDLVKIRDFCDLTKAKQILYAGVLDENKLKNFSNLVNVRNGKHSDLIAEAENFFNTEMEAKNALLDSHCRTIYGAVVNCALDDSVTLEQALVVYDITTTSEHYHLFSKYFNMVRKYGIAPLIAVGCAECKGVFRISKERFKKEQTCLTCKTKLFIG